MQVLGGNKIGDGVVLTNQGVIEMLQVVTKHYRKTKSKGGRKKALTPSDEILVVVLDENAYNGRYFIKDGKKWIHNISALKSQLRIYDDYGVEKMGYDVAAYYQTH